MYFLRQNARLLLVSGAVIFGLIIANQFGWLNFIQHFTGWVVQPMQTTSYQFINQFAPLYYTTPDALITENSNLKTQLAQLAQQNYQLQTQLEQYKDYQNQLNFAEDKQYQFIPAKIISRVGQNDTIQSLTINQGADQGVQVGSPIVYNDGVLIGIVYEVADNYSEVNLLMNGYVKVQAMVINNSKTSGLLSGAFGTGMILEYILKEQNLAIGDVVISKQDRLIPEGLIVGTIQSINDQSSELFKSAMIAPIIHYDSDAIVSVIISQS